MSVILSKSAAARHLGVRPNTLSTWIKRRHLSGTALTADGRIDIEEAERQLAARLDHSRSIGKVAAAAAESLSVEQPGFLPAPISATREMAELKLKQARRLEQREQETDFERLGRYVLRREAERAQTRELQQFLAAVDQRLPELVDLVKAVDGKAAVVAARRWWHGLRRREAEAASARAASMQEFTADANSGIEVTHAA